MNQDQEIVEKAKHILNQNLLHDFINDVKSSQEKTNNEFIENETKAEENSLKNHQFPQRVFEGGKEILFEINGIVYLENEKSEIIGTKSVRQEKFHIPVPLDKNDTEYIEAIFQKFIQYLTESLRSEADNERNN